MDKKRVIQHLIEFIQEELDLLLGTPFADAATADRKRELESLLAMYRFLPSRTYGENDPIIPSSLVRLRTGETVSYTFIAPRGGGFVTTVDGTPLQILTAKSPLGEALLGRKTGDRVTVELRSGTRDYLIEFSA
jgi:transcription elongation GreA/GreB family factor